MLEPQSDNPRRKSEFSSSYMREWGQGPLAMEDTELAYLSTPAPNIIEWITGRQYWNVPSTFDYWGQYQHLRDMFNLRCRICNPQDPESISCWDKSREYLESENLLTWNMAYQDFVCPSCGTTLNEFINDGICIPYNDLILIIGMRAGKSYTGAHIGGYVEHFAIAQGVKSKGDLQRLLGVEKSEWLEGTFAASTATQAQDTIYAKYREMRKNSPWIQRYVGWVKDQEKRQPVSREPWKYKVLDDKILDGYLQLRFNRIASDSAGVAGKTRIFSSIDEWARLVSTESSRSAQELWRVLNQSLKTVRSHTMQHGLITLPFTWMANVTSPLSQDDPAVLHYRRYEEGLLPRTYGHWCPTWEFNPRMPREAFDDEYAKDPLGAERDFGANPPNAAMPLIDDPLRFWGSIDQEARPIALFREEYRSDPTGKMYVSASVADCTLVPRIPRYLFMDAGLSFDAFGIACAHPEWVPTNLLHEEDEGVEPIVRGRIEPVGVRGMTTVEKRFGIHPSGPQALGLAPMRGAYQRPGSIASTAHQGEMLVTVIDFVMRLVPTHDREIWFQSVVDIVTVLKQRLNVALVCADHWSSDSTLQQIRDLGIMSHKVSLKAEQFVMFARSAYNGRVRMLPPAASDKLFMDSNGNMILGCQQSGMSGEGVALVELLKLNRSPDLKKVFNPNKGRVRGVDSDDLAWCVVGAHHMVQDAIIDRQADSLKRRENRKRQVVGQAFRGTILPSKGRR